MRIVLNEAKKAYYNSPYQTYKVTKYLILPKYIKGEIRWLERATWVRKPTYSYSIITLGGKHYHWNDIDWVEEGKECL